MISFLRVLKNNQKDSPIYFDNPLEVSVLIKLFNYNLWKTNMYNMQSDV